MKLVNTFYQVELEDDDIENICNCLQVAIIDMKERKSETVESKMSADDAKEYARINDTLTKLRNLRNDFGRLIGRSWMGADA